MNKPFIILVFAFFIATISIGHIRAQTVNITVNVEVSAQVGGCGDGIISVGETCDGANLGGSSCISQGFTGGALSCSLACTYNTSACTGGGNSGGGNSGGGGGGGAPSIPTTNVVFTGRAYPGSTVTLLKDAQVAATTIADSNANFQMYISGLSTGTYIFSTYSEDSNGIRSVLQTFPVAVTSGVTIKVGNIFIAPTIAVDKSEVKKGDNIIIFGQSAPNSEITINVNSEEEHFIKKTADPNGVYTLSFDTSVLESGQHTTRSKSSVMGEISSYSKVVGFIVGTKNISQEIPKNNMLKGDVNNDKKVNLVDFSITAYWYKRQLTDAFKKVEIERLNGDGKIDLIDFSIIAYNWTG